MEVGSGWSLLSECCEKKQRLLFCLHALFYFRVVLRLLSGNAQHHRHDGESVHQSLNVELKVSDQSGTQQVLEGLAEHGERERSQVNVVNGPLVRPTARGVHGLLLGRFDVPFHRTDDVDDLLGHVAVHVAARRDEHPGRKDGELLALLVRAAKGESTDERRTAVLLLLLLLRSMIHDETYAR